MRFGVLKVSLTYLERILLISTDSLKQNVRRITDLPDDAHIVGIEYDSVKQLVNILLAGSGAELKKIAEGVNPPIIDLSIEALEDET